jgi:hypothetical protein
MTDVIQRQSYPLGVSRPDLAVEDLPTPEEVFRVRRIGPRELIQFAIGPSLIALGISIGSGEWLLGPLSVGQFGFVGVGWIITVSALLQTFYNVECARYVVATGEVRVVGWGRCPAGSGGTASAASSRLPRRRKGSRRTAGGAGQRRDVRGRREEPRPVAALVPGCCSPTCGACSNLGALICPFLLMYLNSKLPRPARPHWWHYVILVLNFLFFGFFFVNFIADFVGDPLVTF